MTHADRQRLMVLLAELGAECYRIAAEIRVPAEPLHGQGYHSVDVDATVSGFRHAADLLQGLGKAKVSAANKRTAKKIKAGLRPRRAA